MPDQDQYHRFMATDLRIREEGGKKLLDIIASTQDAVDFGGYREVLVHAEGSVDTSTCRALLLNHMAPMIAGAIRSCTIKDSSANATAELINGAKMESGVMVEDAVNSGALRGVSIGYSYKEKDCSYDEETRTLTVNKWRLSEISLTAIPADPKAMIRELPAGIRQSLPQPPEKETAMPENVVPAPAVDGSDQVREIVKLAESYGLKASEFTSLDPIKAREAMVAALAQRMVTTKPESPAVVQVTVDEGDKIRSAISDAIASKINPQSVDVKGNPFAGRRLMDTLVRGLDRLNFRDAGNTRVGDMDRSDQARVIIGKRDATAGNISSASLTSFVFLNAITKIVAKGYEMGLQSTKFQRIVEEQSVPDFKTYYLGGLGFQNLQKTAENVALPELTNSEGVYSSSAKMWGGTICLTMQALVNDDTASFERGLRQAGVIAAKTIDRRTMQKLLMGTSAAEGTSTWTSNTTSGCSPVWTTADTLAAARAKYQLGVAAMQAKVGLDGNPTGNLPRFIVCGPTSGVYLKGLNMPAPGQPVGSMSYEVIESPWLEATALTGYSTTTFYLVADPMAVSTLVLSHVSGMENVQVDEYDTGANLARGWKIWKPFEVDLFYFANGAGTNVVPGAHQCTT